MKKYLVGVDLGGTNIKAGVTDLEGRILSRVKIETRAAEGPDVVSDRIAQAAHQAVDSARDGGKAPDIEWDLVLGVGVGSPGTIDLAAGVVTFSPNLKNMNGFGLRDAVSKRLDGASVVLENDANAAARGEQWVGAGRGAHSLVMLTLGTGIGGGIVLENEVWHGANGVAGELGHMSIKCDGVRCACGNVGCIEAYASAPSMVRRMKEAIAAGVKTRLAAETGSLTSKRIYEAAVAGDDAALENIQQTGRFLGIAISNILHMFNPRVVVLSGGVIGAGDMLMQPIVDEVKKRTLEMCFEGTDIRFAELGEDAGFIGAAGCALNAFRS